MRLYIAVGVVSILASAQELPDKFPLEPPPLPPLINKTVQPLKFLESVGQRAALLGREDGNFEAWVYPIKVLRDFRLSVYFDGAMEPAPLAEFAERLAVSPGRVTITHAHAAFTVKQTWVAAVDQPVVAVLLDVDTARPLKLRATFVPEMKPMWPASFGGQSTSWSAKERTLTFTEGLRRFRPVLGSPAFTRITEQIGHQLPDRTVMIEMDITPADANRKLIPILIAGSRDVYQNTLASLADMVRNSDAYYGAFERRTLSIRVPQPVLADGYQWAKYALEKGWACNEGVGCGLIAGWGASGLSERPGFGWYFGGDAYMNSWGILDYGDFERVRALLQFLRDRQRGDGKMMHELTQSAALLDWNQYPYGYYHGDTTPLFLHALARYVRRSGDKRFLEESWAAAEKAYRLCLTWVDPADGLLSNRKAGAAAVETGALSGRVDKDVYLQGAWLAGLDGIVQMSGWLNKPEVAAEATRHLEKARVSLSAWFDEKKGHLPFGRLTDGSNYDALTGWQAIALSAGGLDRQVAERSAAALNRATLSSDWGIRLFATDSPHYDPLSYNDGSVWPFVTGFVAMAEYHHRLPVAGLQHLFGLAAMTGYSGAGFLSEYYSGDRAQALPRSVPHQLFSSSAIVHPLVSGMLGLDGDAMSGTLRVAPQIPPDWGSVKFENYRVGQSLVSGEFQRSSGMIRVQLRLNGPPLRVLFEPVLPVGSRILKGSAPDSAYQFEEGVTFLPELIRPNPGDRPRLVRLVEAREELGGRGVLLALQGPQGTTQDVRVWKGAQWSPAAGVPARQERGEIWTMRVSFPASAQAFSQTELRFSRP